MNLLGFVFAITLILSYGFYACFDKHLSSLRLKSAYLSHQKANRSILNSYQDQVFKEFSGEPVQEKRIKSNNPKKSQKKFPLNQECAKINLWPLIQEGKKSHPLLYTLTAKLIRTFYTPLFWNEKNFEIVFLDALLKSAKEEIQKQNGKVSLEKIELKEPKLQQVFYRMLKGTKKWNLLHKIGLPPLVDYLKIEPSCEPICLFHSNPDLLTVLFNENIAQKLHFEFHRKNGPALTRIFIENTCADMHMSFIEPDLLNLLKYGKTRHKRSKQIFIAENKDVILRKQLILQKGG